MKYYTAKTKRNDIHRDTFLDLYIGMFVKLIDKAGDEYIGQFHYDRKRRRYCMTKFHKNPEHTDCIIFAKSNIKSIEMY